MRRTLRGLSLPALAVALMALALLASSLALPAAAQGAGEHVGSGERAGSGQGVGQGRGAGAGEREGEGHGQGAGRGYFGTNQLIKLIVMAGLAGLALGVVTVLGFRFRKWLLLVSVGVAGFYLAGLLCPICSVQNVFIKWNTAYLLLVLLPVVLALFAGRVYCGYVCPYGALQELLHVRKWAPKIPPRWRRALGLLKYAVLAYLVIHALATWTEILKDMTPFKAFFALGGTPLTLGLSAGFALLSVFTWRPFCEVLCPLGALLSLVSRVSVFRLAADEGCSSCGACTSRCPATTCDGGEVRFEDCFLCGECVRTCGAKSLRWQCRGRNSVTCRGEKTDGA